MPAEPQGLADLHRHLDGSMRLQTLRELATAAGTSVPEDIFFSPGMGLRAALERFQITLSALQTMAGIQRVASEICEDAAADGVDTLEIRFAPQLHGRASAAVEAALEGMAGRAGLLLCGLYGEDPAVLLDLVEIAKRHSGVVGIDLAGGPTSGDAYQLTDYAPAFHAAADAGLGRTVHAGEGRPPQEIRVAIEVLLAQRIGHGTTLMADPAVLDLVLKRDITIEACPTSNLHTGAIASIAEHPLPAWLRAGVKACICTDNTLLSAVRASEELDKVTRIFQLSARDTEVLIANGQRAAFYKGRREARM